MFVHIVDQFLIIIIIIIMTSHLVFQKLLYLFELKIFEYVLHL